MQELGEQLIALRPEQLSGIALDEPLREAIVAARSITAHGALRRQKQLIGKLMRKVDPAPIRAALHALGSRDRREKRRFAEAEKWRNRILDQEAGALDEFIAHIGHDCSELAELERAYSDARSDRERKTVARNVFREILARLQDKVQKGAGSI